MTKLKHTQKQGGKSITRVPICIHLSNRNLSMQKGISIYLVVPSNDDTSNYELSVNNIVFKPFGKTHNYLYNNVYEKSKADLILQKRLNNPDVYVGYFVRNPDRYINKRMIIIRINADITTADTQNIFTVKYNNGTNIVNITPTLMADNTHNDAHRSFGFKIVKRNTTSSIGGFFTSQLPALLQQEYDSDNNEIVANRKLIHLDLQKEINQSYINGYTFGNCPVQIDFPKSDLDVFNSAGAKQWESNKLQFGKHFQYNPALNQVDYKPQWTPTINIASTIVPGTVNNNGYLAYRKKGDLVHLIIGNTVFNTGSTPNDIYNFITLPQEIRPTAEIYTLLTPSQGGNEVPVQLYIPTNGVLFLKKVLPGKSYIGSVQYTI